MDAREDLLCDDFAVLDHIDVSEAHVASSAVFRRVVLAKVLDDLSMSADRELAK